MNQILKRNGSKCLQDAEYSHQRPKKKPSGSEVKAGHTPKTVDLSVVHEGCAASFTTHVNQAVQPDNSRNRRSLSAGRSCCCVTTFFWFLNVSQQKRTRYLVFFARWLQHEGILNTSPNTRLLLFGELKPQHLVRWSLQRGIWSEHFRLVVFLKRFLRCFYFASWLIMSYLVGRVETRRNHAEVGGSVKASLSRRLAFLPKMISWIWAPRPRLSLLLGYRCSFLGPL